MISEGRTPYAGIGSRATPQPVLNAMRALARLLEHHHHLLRSGGAAGADEAFESGLEAPDTREIYLPWRGFNGNKSRLYLERLQPSVREFANEMARRYHPAWRNCSEGARKLHARNTLQIYGDDVLPRNLSRFVICWTKDGKDSGGTGQALRVARDHEIPVYNLRNDQDKAELFSRFDWSGAILKPLGLAP